MLDSSEACFNSGSGDLFAFLSIVESTPAGKRSQLHLSDLQTQQDCPLDANNILVLQHNLWCGYMDKFRTAPEAAAARALQAIEKHKDQLWLPEITRTDSLTDWNHYSLCSVGSS